MYNKLSMFSRFFFFQSYCSQLLNYVCLSIDVFDLKKIIVQLKIMLYLKKKLYILFLLYEEKYNIIFVI